MSAMIEAPSELLEGFVAAFAKHEGQVLRMEPAGVDAFVRVLGRITESVRELERELAALRRERPALPRVAGAAGLSVIAGGRA